MRCGSLVSIHAGIENTNSHTIYNSRIVCIGIKTQEIFGDIRENIYINKNKITETLVSDKNLTY